MARSLLKRHAVRKPIQLSDDFTVGKLIRYAIPSALMAVVTSVYIIIDGLFVSNFVGLVPFAALNLIYPFIQILSSLGFMLGTGGTALVAKTMGQGNVERANGLFSFFVITTFAVSVVLSAICFFFVPDVARLLGAEGELLDYCVLYGCICMLSVPAFMLQFLFQSFFTAAEKPKVGLAFMVAAGITNITLDVIFIMVLGWGLAGAAVGTALGQAVGGIAPIFYFLNKKTTASLHLGKPIVDFAALGKACVNGFSELFTSISISIVCMLYNYQLLMYYGENGVAAYGVIDYMTYIIVAVVMGYCLATAPIISYKHGAKDHAQLKGVLKRSILIVGVTNLVMTVVAISIAHFMAVVFVGYDDYLVEFTSHALIIYAFSFLLMGFNEFGSAFFTALNNGIVSGAIAILRTLVFEAGAVMVLPMFFGAESIWYSVIVAETLSLMVVASFLVALRRVYRYW